MAIMLLERSAILYVLLFLAVLVIEVIETVNHPNINFNEIKFRKTKKLAGFLVLLEIGVIASLTVFNIEQLYINYMSIANILCSSLMCLAKIIKQEVKVR